jgi:hypothetical protein
MAKQLTANQQKGIVDNFLHKLGAKANITYRTQRMYKPETFDFNSMNSSFYEAHMTTYESPIVEMEMPLESLEKMAEDSSDLEELRKRYGENIVEMGISVMHDDWRQRHEASIRRSNPGVQKAWERYQMMLKIAGG